MAIEYDLNKQKRIDFLIEYTRFLTENNLPDQKITNWKDNHLKLLKSHSIDMKILGKKKKNSSNENSQKNNEVIIK